jgi:CHAD domain-containing protein
MLRSPESAGKTARAEPARSQRGGTMARLKTMMACDTAFRIVARRSLEDLTANHAATCRADPAALHQMRIALTRLRTAILFFSPMVADSQSRQIRDELKWLNSHLGTVRDIDVAIERLKAIDQEQPQAVPHYRSWDRKHAASHRRLAQVLRSARYKRLIKSTSDWIENGPWSVAEEKQKDRACSIVEYGAGKLARWQQKLLKKCHKLPKMDARKRHRLRLLNKKLTYSTEFFQDLSADETFSAHLAGLKYLRQAQRSLGRLNDDAQGHALAAALQREGVRAPIQFLSPKREKRLLQIAATAYRKLAALEK